MPSSVLCLTTPTTSAGSPSTSAITCTISQVDYESRRRQIAEAVCLLADEHGPEGVTMRDVAAHAQVSLGAVQRCFRSKEEMLLFAVDYVGAHHRTRGGHVATESVPADEGAAPPNRSAFVGLTGHVLRGHLTAEVAEEVLHAHVADLWERLHTTRIRKQEMRAAFLMTKAVVPGMTKGGYGRIVYLGTVLSRRPRAGMIALGTSKAALSQFARYIAQEMGPYGITVNVVAPGPVGETTTANAVLDQENRQRQSARTVLGRIATPDDVARAVACYAGENSGFIIGLGRAVLSRVTDAVPWTVLCVNTDRPLFWLLARDTYGSVEELKGRRIGIHPPRTAPGCFSRIVLRKQGSIRTTTPNRSS